MSVEDNGLRFIITGPPGAGKTSLIQWIEYNTPLPIVHEAALKVFLRLKAEGLENPWLDNPAIEHQIQVLQVKDMHEGPTKPSIWDRTLVDSLAYSAHADAPVDPSHVLEMKKMKTRYGFNKNVFLIELKPDPKSYEKNEKRPQSVEEARSLEKEIEARYLGEGFVVHRIFWEPLGERARKILQIISDCTKQPVEVFKAPPREYALKDLRHFADGCLQDGPAIRHLLKTDKIWSNFSVVLSRPYIGDRRHNVRPEYDLVEAVFPDFNERRTNFANALVMQHYLTHAHLYAKKEKEQLVTLVFHTLRKTEGAEHAKLLREMLKIVYPEPKGEENNSAIFYPELNVKALFSYGMSSDLLESDSFKEASAVITFSLVAGLNPKFPIGTLLIPEKWIPFQNQELSMDAAASGNNHLSTIVGDIVSSQGDLAARVDQFFQSKNAYKQNQVTGAFAEADFKKATLMYSDDFSFYGEHNRNIFAVIQTYGGK